MNKGALFMLIFGCVFLYGGLGFAISKMKNNEDN